ncbi:MAG: endonuclease [Patescibacteria group bacterium]|nr:endonuclease [Patescibacteria group bacterium]
MKNRKDSSRNKCKKPRECGVFYWLKVEEMIRKMYDDPKMTNEQKVEEVYKRLKKIYPHPRTALDFNDAYQLLIATILSAQCTDKLVNTVTPALFNKYKSPSELAKAPVEEIDEYIKKVTFHGNKAKNIKAAAEMIVQKHNGKVPENMVDLDALPGVARKTANVVLGDAFRKSEGIVVDTHVIRAVGRLGLSKHTDPEKIEKDLMSIVPKEWWIEFPHLLILYGREYAPARPKTGVIDILSDLYV